MVEVKDMMNSLNTQSRLLQINFNFVARMKEIATISKNISACIQRIYNVEKERAQLKSP